MTRNEGVRLLASWKDVPAGARLRLWRDDSLLHSQEVPAGGVSGVGVDVQGEGRFWAELRDAEDALLALTNPVAVRSA